jgi:CRP-like cAMP-binding protein
VPRNRRELVLTDVERRTALHESIGLQGVDADALAALAGVSRRASYPPDRVLVRAGEPRTHVQILLSGDLQVTRAGRAWSHTLVRRFVDLFWLARDSMPLEVKTLNGAEVLELPMEGLEEILEEHFSTSMAFTRLLSISLLETRRSATTVPIYANASGSRLTDRVAALQEALPFARGHIDALMQLDEEAVALQLAAGSALWPSGEPVRSLLVPLRGSVNVAASDEISGIGGIELLAGNARGTPVEVLQPLSALRIGEESLVDVLEDHPALARDLIAMIAASLIRGMEPSR